MNKSVTSKGVVNTPTPVKKRKVVSLDKKKSRAGWWFVLPFVIGLILLYLPMLIQSIEFSFNEINIMAKVGGGADKYTLTFVGWDNYNEALFKDPQFAQVLIASLKQLILDVPAIVIFSLFMAIILNQKMVGRAVFRAIFFIPVILTTGLIDQIDQSNQLLNYMGSAGIDTGAAEGMADSGQEIMSVMDIQALLGNMAVGTELVQYVVDIVNNIFDIVNRSGVQMLIFLSGLQSISPSIYESCTMDGASAWETFWKITFPMISPMILVNTIYTVIDSFTSSSNQVMSYISRIYDGATKNGRVVSSAMSWIYFVVVLLLIAAVAGLLSLFVFYQRRD